MHVWDIAAGAWVDKLDAAHGLDASPPDEQGRTYYDPRTPAVTGRVANSRGIGWAEPGPCRGAHAGFR
ncbi:hypothetical protein [Streptosporangium sp. CA-115845]|uniref:hypothetical protein n=1 Tax=Streptosporangium sp. CA-115845 TaxID=3240071 RepID=UPI003D8F59B6